MKVIKKMTMVMKPCEWSCCQCQSTIQSEVKDSHDFHTDIVPDYSDVFTFTCPVCEQANTLDGCSFYEVVECNGEEEDVKETSLPTDVELASRFMDEAMAAAEVCWNSNDFHNTPWKIIERFARCIAMWMDTAARHADNETYYRNLVIECANNLGGPLTALAHTQDDGNYVPDVLCAKVPELVKKLRNIAWPDMKNEEPLYLVEDDNVKQPGPIEKNDPRWIYDRPPTEFLPSAPLITTSKNGLVSQRTAGHCCATMLTGNQSDQWGIVAWMPSPQPWKPELIQHDNSKKGNQ